MKIPTEHLKPHLRSILDFVGPDKLLKFCDEFGNRQLWIPKRAKIEWLAFCGNIKKLSSIGFSRRQIAQKLDLPIRWVKAALKK